MCTDHYFLACICVYFRFTVCVCYAEGSCICVKLTMLAGGDGSRNSSGKFARRCVINKYNVGEKLTNIQICRYMYRSINRLLSAINEFIQFQMKMLCGCVRSEIILHLCQWKERWATKAWRANETDAQLEILAVSRYFRHNYICILATPPPLQTETKLANRMKFNGKPCICYGRSHSLLLIMCMCV